jgi:hypothetical protein
MNKALESERKKLITKLYRYDRGEIDMTRSEADRIWDRIKVLDQMVAEQEGAGS